MLEVGILNGSISVKGYGGKEVIVEATSRFDEDEDEGSESRGKKAGSMRRIPNTSTGLTVEEENNEVTVSTGMHGISRRVDLVIQVPAACSMNLRTVNEGDIEVENVVGALETNNTNGSIRLKQISGSAVAQTVNGEVQVTLTSPFPRV